MDEVLGAGRGAADALAGVGEVTAQKICEHCGRTFAKPKGRTREQWLARRYCSRSCAFAARAADPEARFWRLVDRAGPDGCWLWRGNVQDREGRRGRFKFDGERIEYAYRIAYTLLVGPIAEGAQCHHVCENPNCVNPDHLELVSPGEHVDIHKLGVPRPVHVRRSISQALRSSPKAAAANAARRGVPRSDEVKRKISEVKRVRWAQRKAQRKAQGGSETRQNAGS